MELERVENNCDVIYKREGEIIGRITYNFSAPSEESLRVLAKRILILYKESLREK